jgi:hypothetical protein
MRARWWIVLLLLVMVVPACKRGKAQKPVYPVKGRIVDSNDKPAVGALVVFHPIPPDTTDTTKPVAQVDDSGSFTLTTYKENDGAPEGEYGITIIWPQPRKSPFDPPGPDQLKGQYSDPATPKVRFTVEKKPQNEVPPIKVTAS